ncbi:MAG: putative RND superfamily exporter protein, partial [Myxococcota bacterium]
LFPERLPLDIGSSMIASIALGVGIDYAIHFLWRYREAGLVGAMRNTGRAIVINAVEITAGFVVLVGASIVPMSNFGLLTAETLLTAAVATLVLMPAMVHWWRPEPSTQASATEEN